MGPDVVATVVLRLVRNQKDDPRVRMIKRDQLETKGYQKRDRLTSVDALELYQIACDVENQFRMNCSS